MYCDVDTSQMSACTNHMIVKKATTNPNEIELRDKRISKNSGFEKT